MLNRNGFLVVMLGLVLAGCGGSSGLNGQQSPRIRLFNGADGQATIFATFQDANLNNLGTSPNASYGAATTDTLIANTTATATIQGPASTLFTTAATLYRENSFYSLYVYGSAFQNYHALPLSDSQLVSAGQTFGLRAVQLGTKNPNVDVYVQPGVTPLGAANLAFSGVALGNVTSPSNTLQAVDTNGYILPALNANTLFTVSVTVAGSTTPIATTTVTVTQGAYYTVVVYDSPTGAASSTSVAVLSDRRLS
jgi:hypothetical protein